MRTTLFYLLMILLLLPSVALSASIITITPKTVIDTILINNPSTILYTITNNSSLPINDLAFRLPPNTAQSTTLTTCTTSLAANQSCDIAINVTPTSLGTLSLPLSVFSFNGSVCIQTTDLNVITLTVVATPFVTIEADTVFTNQHFALRAVNIINGAFKIAVGDIILPNNLAGKVTLCSKTANTGTFFTLTGGLPIENTNFCGLNSECAPGDILEPNTTCQLWFRAQDVANVNGVTVAPITIDTSGGSDTISATYSRHLYVAGNFVSPSGTINNVAKLVGNMWVPVGSNNASVFTGLFTATVRTLVIDGMGDLVAGGNFIFGGLTRVGRLLGGANGTWLAVTPLDSVIFNDQFAEVSVDNTGQLIAFGNFTGGGLNRIIRLEKGVWTNLGVNNVAIFDAGINGVVVDRNGNLSVVGDFTTLGGARIAFLDNSGLWLPQGGNAPALFVAGSPFDILNDKDGNLIIFGDFSGGPAELISKLLGNTWGLVGVNDPVIFPAGDIVFDMARDGNGNLMAVGSFPTKSSRLIGNTWGAIGSNDLTIASMEVFSIGIDTIGQPFQGNNFITGSLTGFALLQNNIWGPVAGNDTDLELTIPAVAADHRVIQPFPSLELS